MCKGIFPITEGSATYAVDGIVVVLDEMKIACGAALIASGPKSAVSSCTAKLLFKKSTQNNLLRRDYKYYAAGQLTHIHDSRRGPLSYRYDPVGRLLNATSRLGVETFASTRPATC